MNVPVGDPNRRTIQVSCRTHQHPPNYCNLRVTRNGNRITLDPHVDGSCVVVLGEKAATALFDLLGEWLGG